jgi:hypothetical protein
MKTIGELNNILRRELGDRDISYAWMRMDDTRLLRTSKVALQMAAAALDGRSRLVY